MHSDLIAKMEALDGPSREVDKEIHEATNPKLRPSLRYGNIPELTASLDAAIALVERVLPDTDDRRHSCTIWTGRRPAARIFYRQRCAEDEGGWAIGALNNWDVRGATPAIALLIALLQVKEAQDG